MAKATIPDELWDYVEELIDENDKYGYGSVSELTKDLLRRWIDRVEDEEK